MASLIRDQQVRCSGDQHDKYGRALVHCYVGDTDVNRAMVRAGWAVAAYGHEYDLDMEHARTEHAGAWAGTFQKPASWRKHQLP
jgi:endonuclease YncB( thermonuclease family)